MMKCLILAAGYATRLYPLTENFPKPLLQVAGKPILDWLIDDIDTSGEVDEYIVISNHKFFHIFEQWASAKGQVKITVLDDGTTSNEDRLGAVRDIDFAIEQLGLDDDLLIMAGDNLLDFSLEGFIRCFMEKKSSCVMRYYEGDSRRLSRSGVVEVDADGLILSMEEKPASPKSHWCVPAFYCYTREDAAMIGRGIENGCATDAPGSYVSWLAGNSRVYAWEMPGRRYDIGSLESYEEVKRIWENKNC